MTTERGRRDYEAGPLASEPDRPLDADLGAMTEDQLVSRDAKTH